jgi:hypothetical protein
MTAKIVPFPIDRTRPPTVTCSCNIDCKTCPVAGHSRRTIIIDDFGDSHDSGELIGGPPK